MNHALTGLTQTHPQTHINTETHTHTQTHTHEHTQTQKTHIYETQKHTKLTYMGSHTQHPRMDAAKAVLMPCPICEWAKRRNLPRNTLFDV